ncbi:MAG: hypothetical protein DMG18_09830, partial [Acidobacteria bacterium]
TFHRTAGGEDRLNTNSLKSSLRHERAKSCAVFPQQTAWKDGSLEKEMSIGVLSLRFVTEAV